MTTKTPLPTNVVSVTLDHDPDAMTIQRHYRDGSAVTTYAGPVCVAETAPDLLTSLKALVSIYDEHLNLSRCAAQIAAARAAIQKAETT